MHEFQSGGLNVLMNMVTFVPRTEMRPHRITYPALLLSALIASSTMAYGADERIDTLSSSKVSSSYGSIVVPQRIAGKELKASANISEAVRRFAGVQVRDYGGVGGLKTVNVRSLGSEHTGVFIDGIQVDNAQNMQVDLGRFSTDNLRSVSLFNGQKASFLQSAREYSSASSVYLETARPEFGRRKWNRRVRIRGGSFGTFSPGLTLERLLRGGASLRLTGEAVSSDGRYRFHVSDFRHTPEGTMAGYDTVMTRRNCDLRSVRVEAQLFSGKGSESDWLLHAYYYDSERGLPGPVFKRAGGYPLSEDRQADRNMFAQGRWSDRLGARLTVSARFKYAFDKLEYLDFPELRPEANPADFTYRNHTAYVSAAALADILDWWKVNVAADVQYGHLSANLRDFSSPDRTTVYTSLTNVFSLGSLEAYATLLYLNARDSFRNPGSGRGKASRDAFMPSVVARLRLSDGLSVNGFAKRSYRLPTFNDLYYTTTGSKSLAPEDATQLDLGLDWSIPATGLTIKADIYHNSLKDKIIAVPTSNQFRWSMYNIGKVRILGADVSAVYEKTFGRILLGCRGRYTYQKATDLSDREAVTYKGQIPYIPLHSGSGNIFMEILGWRLDATFFATGERFSSSANLPAYRIAPWQTLDASLSKSFKLTGSELALRISLNNILGENYEIVDNYPMPGTNLIARLEYSF